MKILKAQLIALAFFCNIAVLHAMESKVMPDAIREEDEFINMSISDIYNLAQDLQAETGQQYSIVQNSAGLERCLQILGLNVNNTPLDIRFHCDLLLKKLSENDPLNNVIIKTFNQLMAMLFVFEDYQEEVHKLVLMDSKEVEKIELQHRKKPYEYLRDKDNVIKKTVALLEKQQNQFKVKQQLAASSPIHALLELPVNTSSRTLGQRYNSYMRQNSPDKFIALQRMNKISRADLKEKMNQVEKVKSAYEDYREKENRID